MTGQAGQPLVAPEAIADVFRWDDPTIYRWSVRWGSRDDRGDATDLVGALVGTALGPPAVTYLLCSLMGLASTRVSFWVAVALGVVVLLDYLGGTVAALAGRGTLARRVRVHTRPLLAGTAVGCLAWVIACPGSPVGAGFSGAEGGIPQSQWLLCFWEHIRATLLLDLPRLFGGRLTSISPVSTLALAAAVGFRILFGLGVVELAVYGWRRYRAGRAFHATVRGAWVWCSDPTSEDGELRREGRLVEPPGGSLRVRALDFVVGYRERAES